MRRRHGDSAPITRLVRVSVAAHRRSARRLRVRPRQPRRPYSSIGSEARSRQPGTARAAARQRRPCLARVSVLTVGHRLPVRKRPSGSARRHTRKHAHTRTQTQTHAHTHMHTRAIRFGMQTHASTHGAQPTAAPQCSRSVLPVGPCTHRSRGANGADRRTDPRRRSVGVQRQDAILRDMRRRRGDSAPITRLVRGSAAAHSRSARGLRTRPRRPRRPHASIGSEARSHETGNSPCRRSPAPAAPRGIVGAPVPTYAALHWPIPTCACGRAGARVGVCAPFGRGAHGVCCRCP
jgi:hypothetical protein